MFQAVLLPITNAQLASSPDSVNLLTVLLVALGLSADCFAVALGVSMSSTRAGHWRWLKTSLSFGFFQALMPVIGWLLGRTVIDLIGAYDHWVAFGLLAFVGGKMLWESFHSDEGRDESVGRSSLVTLLTLSFATSIDALAVGLSFAFVQVDIVQASVIIGVVAFLVTGLGFLIGRRAGALLGRRAEAVGGLVLIGIGLRILLTHLLG